MDSIFDRALSEIGQDGRFQKMFDIIYNVVLSILWTMAYMNLMLALIIVPYTCHIPGKPNDVSELSWRQLNIPVYTNAAGEVKFHNCLMYTNYSLHNNTKVCDTYDYDKTWYERTVPTENNWVCDKELYVANILASSKIGELVGSIAFGWYGDTYGRRPTYIISLLLIIFGRAVSLLAGTSFILFVFGTVVAALPSWSVLQSVTAISMEISSPTNRTLTASLRFAGWSVGLAATALLFWCLRDWKIFFIATTATQVPFLLFSWKMIESPRWLWVQGKTKECVKYLKYIAKKNNKNLSKETEEEILTYTPVKNTHGLGYLALFSGWTLAKNTILQLIAWICYSTSYTVILMSSGEKTDGNPFLESVWQSLAELPGYFIAAWLADRIGRRYTGSNVVFRNSLVGSTLAVINRMSATISYSIITIFNMELYPTCIRQSGMSLGNLFISAGSALAPYMLYLGRRYSQLSNLILIGISLFGIICIVLLPETLNEKLPETIEDAQAFGKKKLKYLPVSSQS
ncbi:unnamed protein product [Parnassius mnemosyne]|uniref:Major facilitator superfamily (MFS) profile domain-containing protein n=1 Tax=Parnassius mnemosyne TaxID=213953 RepID=A0AAV1KFG3_9NEOP